MSASLFVVATPIGNLEDITLRALTVLKTVSIIAAEDTRRTGTLLRHFGITTPTTSFHAHNERQKLSFLLQKLSSGQNVALVSDAGTPVVADPGQRLIAGAIGQGTPIVSIPGASAVTAAMAVSGLPADSFVFAGFAPSRSNDRNRWLQTLAVENRPVIFFEAPHRIRQTCLAMASILGERQIIVCRELTKLHEEVIRVAASQLTTLEITARGEFAIVIAPPSADAATEHAAEEVVYQFFYQLTEDGLDRRPALTRTARKFGLSTKTVYAVVERLKSVGPP